MSERLEKIILSNLFYNEEYTRKVLPFLQEEFFANRFETILFQEINSFVNKYKNLPTKETILVELNQRKDINEDDWLIVSDVDEIPNLEGLNLNKVH